MSTKREHTKSRLGCKQCKRRRIKCDQNPPRCDNCKKKGLDCDYQEWEDVFRSVQFLAPQDLSAGEAQTMPGEPAEPSNSSHTASTFTLDDLGLLSHFILHTSPTMDFGGEHTSHVWQYELPRIAQSHAFLMHAVLAFAALHRATTGQEQGLPNLQLARHHYGRGLSLFRQHLDESSDGPADAMLCFGILINLLTIKLELEKPMEGRDPVNDFSKFFDFLQNSIGVLAPFRESFQASPIASGLRNAFNAQLPHTIAHDVDESLDHLTQLVMLQRPGFWWESDEAMLFNDTVAKLRQFFTFVEPRPSTWVRILNWPMQVDPKFSILLQQRDPVALCVLAHWCVPFHNAPTRWYIGQRPRLLMLAIAGHLHGTEWAEGIRWPLSETVGELQI